jgi:diguanylate cyclase (GGDEF)-like protein/PAS domain S-box-containing protein
LEKSESPLQINRHTPSNKILDSLDTQSCFAKNTAKQNEKEAELIRITQSLNLAQEIAKIGSWDYDVASDRVYCSEALFTILGINYEEGFAPKYADLLAMICPEDRDVFDNHFQKTKYLGRKMELEYRIQKLDRSILTVNVKAEAKKDGTGKINRIIGVLYDISVHVQTENRLKESEKKFEMIAGNLDVGIWSMDYPTHQLVYVSTAIEKITGYCAQFFISGKMDWTDLIHPDDIKNYHKLQVKRYKGKMLHHQYRILNACGEVKWLEDKTFPILDSKGNLIRLDGIIQDISERKRTEEKINYFAYHDFLTELPNRRRLDQKLEKLIANYQVNKSKFALLSLDMDRFKFVNDTLGHGIGDALLVEISRRLSTVSEDNTVYRVGGDEFTIIQQNPHEMDPISFGKEVVSEIQRPFQIEGYDIHITTSIGIGIFPDDGDSLKKLQLSSDIALYRSKELGKNNVQLFTKALSIEANKLFTLENDLRKATQKDQFILHYQSRVDTLSGGIVGAEALIRWNHPELGLVPPGEFIPLAEETGVINEISMWVIQQVCKQLKEWEGNGYQLVPISINLSARTLMKADLVIKIKENLSKYSISPKLIEIEITEDSLINNEGSTLPTIQHLRDLGIAIAIDDFGTGYSSIGYLKKFKVDFIKIDRSYIKDLLENMEDSIIVQSIILLAKGFQLKIVAEGVETEEQWERLKLLNCHNIQGFLFSKPVPAEQFEGLLLKDIEEMIVK